MNIPSKDRLRSTPDAASPGARLIVVALCLMVCAVPLVLPASVYEPAFSPKWFALHACIALTCLGWLVQTRWGRNARPIATPLLLPLLCWMGVGLLSAPATTHPLDTAVHLINQAVLIVLFLVAANALPLQHLGPILWTSALTGLVVALIGILQYHALAFLHIPSSAPPSATFVNRNLAAEYLICAIPLSGLLFLTSRRWAALLVSGLSATLMGVYLVYTRTRGAWMGLGGSLLCIGGLLAFWPGMGRPVIEAVRSGLDRRKGVLMLGFCILFGVLSVLPPPSSVLPGPKADIASVAMSVFQPDAIKDTSLRERLAFWTGTLRMVADRPLLGVGPGGWVRAYPPYDRGATIAPKSAPRWPHNDYLWIASEYGLLGLGAYIWFLVVGLRCLLAMARSQERFQRIAALMFTLSILSILGDALFAFPKDQPQAALFPYLLLGIAAGAAEGEREEEKRHRESEPSPPHTPPSLRRRGRGDQRLSPAMGRVRPFASRLVPYLLLVVSLSGAELFRRRVEFDRHYLRATLWVKLENWPAVLTEAQRALEYGAFRPHLLYLKGIALQSLERYPEAEAAYRQAIAYTPHAWYVHKDLGLVCLQQGRLQDALLHCRNALSICPNCAEAHRGLGAVLKEKRDLDGAISQFRQAIQINPDYAEAHNLLGVVLASRGDLDSALSEWRQAIRTRPDYAEAHNNLGAALRGKGDLDSAIAHYRRAIQINPDYARAYYNLGIALTDTGDRAGAVEALRVCLRTSAEDQMRAKARDALLRLGGTP